MFRPKQMFKSVTLLLIVLCGGLFLLEGCNSSGADISEEPVIEERDPRFAQCYYEDDIAKHACDSVLISFFGADAFSLMKINTEFSFIGCDEGDDLEMLLFGDKNCCLPRTYDLVYDVIYKGDTVLQVPLFAGSEMNFEFASQEEKAKLLPYTSLLRGEIEFDYADLSSEMKRRNMNPASYEIELINDTLTKNVEHSIFWELSYIDENDEMMYFRVNARNGVFTTARPMSRMGD